MADVIETTMLERAARALSESLANAGVQIDGGTGVHTTHLFLAELPTDAVRAVLQAIREPSDSVLFEGEVASRHLSAPLMETAWQAMIDAALAE